MNPSLPLYDQQQFDFNTLSDISSLLFWKIEGKLDQKAIVQLGEFGLLLDNITVPYI